MNENSNTGSLLYGDPLGRRLWLKEGALAAGKTSFWKKFTANNSFHSPINQQHGLQTTNNGNHITFDFDGFIAQEPIHGDAQVSGTGTNRRKFSASMQTREFHNSVAVGQHWDLNLIGSVELRRMAKQRNDLLDMRKRIGDQAKFDVVSGFFMDDAPSNILFGKDNGGAVANGTMEANIAALNDKPSLEMLENIINIAITGEGTFKRDAVAGTYGADSGRSRPGLTQWTDPTANGEEVQTIDLLVDWYFLRELNKDPSWRKLWTIISGRSENELFSATTVVYKNIRLHRMPLFKGKTSVRELNRTAVEQAGSRRMSEHSDGSGKLVWEGMDGFQHDTGATIKQWGMATLIGAGAVVSHSAFRPHDEFTVEYNNHKSRKEAAIHYYMNVKRGRLFEHNGDYHMLKMSDYDLGLINIAYKIQG